MSHLLGICVGEGSISAICGLNGIVSWAGSAAYSGPDELADVVARLVAEGPPRVRRARVVLARELVQLRTIDPAPPIPRGRAADYVALEAGRLFRRNGAPLVTDARVLRVKSGRVLRAAAATEPLVRAVLDGCAQAGLIVETIGPAADVLAYAIAEPIDGGVLRFPNGRTTEVVEVWRHKALRGRLAAGVSDGGPVWTPALDSLGAGAGAFAAAYGATRARPALELWPEASRAARSRRGRRRAILTLAIGACAWAAAAGVYAARLGIGSRAATREMAALQATVDSAIAVRRDLAQAAAAAGIITQANALRSRRLMLLADVTRVLSDSTTIVSFRVGQDGVVSLAGYAPLAARVRADLERVGALERIQFEGPVVRETVGEGATRREVDRFALSAHVKAVP